MRRVLFVLAFLVFGSVCIAQTIENPVFDRSDVPAFRVERVVITSDTTYVYCLYHAEEQSWASLSDNTFLENIKDGRRLPILKVSGIPFGPEQRVFTETDTIQVVLYFPHTSAEKFNIIENENNEAFNIYGIDLMNSYERSYTENDVETYYNIAMTNEGEKQWQVAIDYLLKQLEASKYVYGIRSKEASWPMFSLTMQYFGLGDYEKMIEWGKQAIDILSVLPPDSLNLDVLARAYGNVSSAYSLLKQPAIATQYMELSLATKRQKDGVGAISYEDYLRKLSQNYYYQENYPKALLYGKEVANIYEKKYNENNYKYGCVYINSLNNLCEFYQRMELFEEAAKCGEKALDLVDRGVCDDSSWIKYYVYNNYAGALLNTREIDKAIFYLEKVISEGSQIQLDRLVLNTRMLLADILLEYKQDTIKTINEYKSIVKTLEDSIAIGKKNYYEYTSALHKLYKIYMKVDPDIGMHYLNKVIAIQKEWNGEESVAYANLLLEYINSTYIKTIIEKKGVDTLLYNLNKSSAIIKRHINNSIYNMSKNERRKYWQRYKNVFTWEIPMICGRLETPEAYSLAYNTSLFYKGMLLSSEKEFKDAVSSSNDSTLVLLYNDYVRNLSLLEKEYAHTSNSTTIDSLKILIQNEEYTLSQKVTRFNRECKGTNFSWEEVKQKLGDDDIAIEIVSYNGHDNSNTYYDAYIINNKSEFPKLACLFNEKWLDDYSQQDSIDNAFSSWIWGNDIICEEIKDAKNIYISPSGILNTIGIEYLPISGGRYINEKFNIVRLSSTRELCMPNENESIKDVCLYGGLDYNDQIENTIINKTDSVKLSRSVVDSIEKRGGFDFLTGSKEEIEQISKEIIGKGVKCHTYTGSNGTEATLKQLSGHDIDIIHLSTHGMYVPLENTDPNKNKFGFVIDDKTTNIDEEDQSLTHSFLVMSGGNLLIKNMQDKYDDGILTALEVSHLDFSNLGLVVLSACQTALGRIESEGVYGLQRGFKKAGANTILMSLDKVDDEATKILMVEFYKNLMSGKSKHQSLKDAQKHLRQVDNGKYDKPEYWASFIMLDGLD